MNTIKDMVKDNKEVRFVFYRKGQLFYETECGFLFPVDIEDTGDGEFKARDKAIFFMRYIKKQMKSIEDGKENNENP